MDKKVITEQLLQVIWTCEMTLSLRDNPFFIKNSDKLKKNFERCTRSFSGSWLGYHANVYYRNLDIPEPGNHFSPETGLADDFLGNPLPENWIEYSPEFISNTMLDGVDTNYESLFTQASNKAQQALEENYETIRTILDALNTEPKAATLERINNELGSIKVKIDSNNFIELMRPRAQIMSRDRVAISQGFYTPVHIIVQAEELVRLHSFSAIETIIGSARKIMKYMEINALIERTTISAGHKVFIGHGRSLAWRELKDFLQDRLHVNWEEFNRESTAGMATAERLQEMLDASCFAFLVMTAEDQHSDKTLHARENVVHEVGLFQGRLSFRKAIIVLEEGCSEFSNITGLSQIRFPRGNISACFEEIRKVLEREGMP